MTAEDLVRSVGAHPLGVLAFAILPPLAAWVLGALHGRGCGGTAPWKHGYSALVYFVSFPGMLALVLTLYTLFFTGDDLRHVNVLVYFVPLVTMFVTLGLISRRVSFHEIPGFDRIEGLLAVIAATFVLILMIRKTGVWIVFHGSIGLLLVLIGVVFVLFKWMSSMIFGTDDHRETRAAQPSSRR